MTAPVSTIDELAATILSNLLQDEHFAREACGATVVGELGNWRQAPGGDEWEAVEVDDFVMLLVALRPGLRRATSADSGYWGQVAAWQDDGDGERGPLKEFRHAARHDPATVLRDVAARRALVEQLLGEEHGTYRVGGEDFPCDNETDRTCCDCGRDARVAGYLRLLAQAWQETT